MLTIGDKAYEHYAKIHLAKMNPDSEEVDRFLQHRRRTYRGYADNLH